MYGTHDGPDLDENLSRKFLTVCKEIFLIEKDQSINPINFEQMTYNKIHYVDIRPK